MKKLIDFDELFDRKLAQYMEEHAGEYSEKQWEDLIPRLYRNFGDTLIKSVGTTPKGYYAEMTAASWNPAAVPTRCSLSCRRRKGNF